ncbi:putative MFS alpha-glucoside transporter [Xylaria venustula]|nr:putative MFS alpha-glucoside transporter [Xylaria venustula]
MLPFASITSEARIATAKEHQMNIWQGIKLYPKAIFWSMMISMAVVMEGFDNALIGSFYAVPAFQKKFGEQLANGVYGLTAPWQAGLSGAVNAGEVLGLLLNGYIAERLGYKKTMLAALSAAIALVPLLFFAQSKPMLLAGELLLGFPLGIFQTLTISYASEVCPVILRGFLATYVNLSWVIGQLLALSVLKGLLNNTTEWSYKIPFAIEWAWPALILSVVAFAPESPWWHVRHNDPHQALNSLRRLIGNKTRVDFDAKQTISMMIHTNQIEKNMSATTCYLDCFRGVNYRRTGITCLVTTSAALCGSGLMAYSAYFYLQAGLSTQLSFTLSAVQYALGFFGTLLSLLLVPYFGRRTMFISGLLILGIILAIIGFLAVSGEGTNISLAIGSSLLVFVFAYNCAVGAPSYVLVSEIPSTRLRSKTLVISRVLYNALGIVNSVIIPYMLNPTVWNWKGKTGFFWAGLCFLCFILCFFCLPETEQRTYAELDILFEQKVGARRFKVATADPFQHSLSKSSAPPPMVALEDDRTTKRSSESAIVE